MSGEPKNIVICSDGTANTANKGRGTNVFKLFEAVDVDDGVDPLQDANICKQVAIYDDGVGTQKLKAIRLVAGAFGHGLARNVRQLYAELARVCAPGDRIYLFGFSRGAFTVRTLAGFVDHAGILDPESLSASELEAAVGDLYRAYRKSRPALLEHVTSPLSGGLRRVWRWLARHATGSRKPTLAFQKHKAIRFVGVWDTVDAVGFPFPVWASFWNLIVHRFKFNERRLPNNVEHASHALAIDEERASFAPFLWRHDPKRTEQVWFAGVHSNVGGGYPKQGMSLVTLDWMMDRAVKASGGTLRFTSVQRQLYREAANVDDTLYDSRAGLAVYYRYKPRNVKMLCCEVDAPVYVHSSVIARIQNRTRGYAPVTLPSSFATIETGEQKPIPVALNLVDSDKTGGDTAPPSPSLESGVTSLWVRWRQITQALFYSTQLGAIGLAIRKGPVAKDADALPQAPLADGAPLLERLPAWLLGVAENAVAPIPSDVAQEYVVRPMFAFPSIGYVFLAAFVVSYIFGLVGRTRVEHHSSERWLRSTLNREASPES